MKRCICHFVKWQIHPFISKGGDKMPLILIKIVCESSSVKSNIYSSIWEMSIFHIKIYFCHLKLGIATAIPASNEKQIEINNSTAEGVEYPSAEFRNNIRIILKLYFTTATHNLLNMSIKFTVYIITLFGLRNHQIIVNNFKSVLLHT